MWEGLCMSVCGRGSVEGINKEGSPPTQSRAHKILGHNVPVFSKWSINWFDIR